MLSSLFSIIIEKFVFVKKKINRAEWQRLLILLILFFAGYRIEYKIRNDNFHFNAVTDSISVVKKSIDNLEKAITYNKQDFFYYQTNNDREHREIKDEIVECKERIESNQDLIFTILVNKKDKNGSLYKKKK